MTIPSSFVRPLCVDSIQQSRHARKPRQYPPDGFVDPLLEPLLIVNHAVHAAFGPATPDHPVGAGVDEVEQECARLVDIRLAVALIAGAVLAPRCRRRRSAR